MPTAPRQEGAVKIPGVHCGFERAVHQKGNNARRRAIPPTKPTSSTRAANMKSDSGTGRNPSGFVASFKVSFAEEASGAYGCSWNSIPDNYPEDPDPRIQNASIRSF